MIRLIKNNVLPGTLASITILWLFTFDMDVKSLSALWFTDVWMLYTAVLTLNGVLFMIGDNQIINKIAGLLLLIVVLFPLSKGEVMTINDWLLTDYIHHTAAILFFIVKSLNHRKYDYLIITVGAATLFGFGYSLYQIEIVGLYTLVYTGYLKKKNYFRKTRIWLRNSK